MKLSIVVPVRDDPRIDDLLASLALQRGAPSFEVLVALDGSRREPRVPSELPARLLRLLPEGPYAARNSAVREAVGDIILLTDSDCLCPPDWVAKAAREFEDSELSALAGASVSARRDRLSRYVQIEYDRYVASHAASGFRRFCNTRNFGARSSILRAMPLPEQFPRGGDGVYGAWLEARGIPIRYQPEWNVEHRHPTARWREGHRAFEEGFHGQRWALAQGVDLFGGSAQASGSGARLLSLAKDSRMGRRAAVAALFPLAAVFAAASAVLPERAGAAAFSRFRRACHLAGRLAGGARSHPATDVAPGLGKSL